MESSPARKSDTDCEAGLFLHNVSFTAPARQRTTWSGIGAAAKDDRFTPGLTAYEPGACAVRIGGFDSRDWSRKSLQTGRQVGGPRDGTVPRNDSDPLAYAAAGRPTKGGTDRGECRAAQIWDCLISV